MVISIRQPAVRRACALLVACILSYSSAAFASGDVISNQPPDFQPNPQARDLVRKIVANELKQEELDKSRYMFKLKRVNPKGCDVKQIVQTDQGSIAKTLLLDGKPPTDEVRQAEEQ